MSTQRSRRLAALSRAAPVVLLLLVTATFVALSARSPSRMSLGMSWAPPSLERPFGSGDAGVDLLALTLHATFRALLLGGGVALVGFALGTPLGTSAGILRGRLLSVTLRACDLVQSFPSFLLALAVLSAVRAPTRWHIAAVFCLTAWAPFARISAALAQTLAESQFVEAARALGLGPTRTLLGHVAPNLLGPVAIQIGSAAAGVVLGETALGFVGLGPPDGVSLGALLEQGTLGMLRAPHVLCVGAVAVVLVSGALQLASEGLRRLWAG